MRYINKSKVKEKYGKLLNELKGKELVEWDDMVAFDDTKLVIGEYTGKDKDGELFTRNEYYYEEISFTFENIQPIFEELYDLADEFEKLIYSKFKWEFLNKVELKNIFKLLLKESHYTYCNTKVLYEDDDRIIIKYIHC